MENEIQKLYNLPEISFIEGITYEGILNQMIADYEKYYEEKKNRKIEHKGCVCVFILSLLNP